MPPMVLNIHSRDRAEGVVGEGVHAGVLEALLRRPAVPAFPDARRPVLDREAPGGERVVVEAADRRRPSGRTGSAWASGPSCRRSRWRGASSRSRMSSTRYLTAWLSLVLGQQVEGQGQDVDGLRVALDPAVRRDVGLVERLAMSSKSCSYFWASSFLPSTSAASADQLRAVGEVGRGEHVLGRVGLDREPVAVALRPAAAGPCMCLGSTRSTSASQS